MPARLTYDEVYEYIKGKGYELLSREYTSATALLDMRCGVCHKEYKQIYSSFKKGYFHPFCQNEEKKPFGGYKTPFKLVPILCKVCKKEFKPKYARNTICSTQCNENLYSIPEYLEKARLNCKKAGQKSAANQSRRSKNEIYFSELCSNHFDITTNEPFFEGWDADVIIHS